MLWIRPQPSSWPAYVAGMNLIGGKRETLDEIHRVQNEVFSTVNRRFIEWGIEHNENGERADAFLYCVEVKLKVAITSYRLRRVG